MKTIISLIFLVGVSAQAQTSQPTLYETALVVPWKYLTTALQTTAPQTYTRKVVNLQLTAADVPVVIPEVDFTTQIQLKKPTSSGVDNVWESSSAVAQIAVAPFTVTKKVKEVHGGVTVIVTLNATCTGFTLNQKQAYVKAFWSLVSAGNNVQPQLTNFQVSWPANSWTLQGLACQGPAGFADVVQSQVMQQLADTQAISQWLKGEVQNSLNEEVGAQLAAWSAPHWAEDGKSKYLKFYLTRSSIVPATGLMYTLIVRGSSSGDSGADTSGNIVPFTPPANILAMVGSLPTVIMSAQAMGGVVQDMAALQNQIVDLQTIPAFVKMLASPSSQFNVWSDLKYYSKTSPFRMESVMESKPSIVIAAYNHVRVSAVRNSVIYSQRDNKEWSYINIRNVISLLAHISLTKGTFELDIERYESEPTLKYGADYKSTYKPSGYLSETIVEKTSTTNLSQVNFFKVPALQVSNTMSFKAQTMTRPQSDIFMLPFAN